MVAISTDPPSESQKTAELLDRAFPLLGDPELRVINAFQMRHQMGSQTTGDMGYVIVDGQGFVREVVSDPLFGKHARTILQSLRALPASN